VSAGIRAVNSPVLSLPSLRSSMEVLFSTQRHHLIRGGCEVPIRKSLVEFIPVQMPSPGSRPVLFHQQGTHQTRRRTDSGLGKIRIPAPSNGRGRALHNARGEGSKMRAGFRAIVGLKDPLGMQGTSARWREGACPPRLRRRWTGQRCQATPGKCCRAASTRPAWPSELIHRTPYESPCLE